MSCLLHFYLTPLIKLQLMGDSEDHLDRMCGSSPSEGHTKHAALQFSLSLCVCFSEPPAKANTPCLYVCAVLVIYISGEASYSSLGRGTLLHRDVTSPQFAGNLTVRARFRVRVLLVNELPKDASTMNSQSLNQQFLPHHQENGQKSLESTQTTVC